jgi:short-subunit dehydrogenase
MHLANRVVLMTGASKGIGAAAAAELARRGAKVVLAARSLDLCEENAARIRRQGGEARAVRMDVTDDASVAQAMAQVGPVDIVVGNAGDPGPVGLWMEQEQLFTREMMEAHFFGAQRVIRAALPGMVARGEGLVVSVVSALAWAAMPGAAAYCASKAAVLGFSDALRGELRGSGVDVLVFGPAHTATHAAFPIETPQVLTPEEVARDLARSIEAGRREFVSGLSNRNLVRLQRLFPRLAARIIGAIGLRAVAQLKQLPGATMAG